MPVINLPSPPVPFGTVPRQPITDLNVPNYDREQATGNYLVVSFNNGQIVFSSYCPSYSRALAMTRLSKLQPTWVLNGLESELQAVQKICSMRADWLTPGMVTNLLQSQLGKTLKILTTFNLNKTKAFK